MKAFPVQGLSNEMGLNFQQVYEQGMDLRDYFACHALQGLIIRGVEIGYQNIAKNGYEIADAMMKARAA
jgi:hypothetical protein